MRLSDKKPTSFLVKVAFFLSKQRFGKVISPLRKVYSRRPSLLGVAIKIDSTEKKLSLSKQNRQLIRTFVSALNNCSFCADINLFLAGKINIDLEKINTIQIFRNTNIYSDKEKAMLSYCEEVTLTKTCTDGCFRELKKHFSEEEIIEITWLNSTENYYNLIGKPLQLESDNLRS